jgi:hypothetical protein
VWNVDTGDANYVPFDNTNFWTSTGPSQGTNAGHYTADYKSAVVHADLVGSQLLILAHNEGTQLAWRAWTLATARTPAELTAVATNSTVTGTILGSSNTANLDVYEAVVRPGGQIRANWRYGYTTSYDEARFVNDAAPALSSANNGDDTVAGIGTWMNVNSGMGSRWDAGYGWDGAGYQKALMGSDEVAGDSWPTTNSRGLHYDYAIFVR